MLNTKVVTRASCQGLKVRNKRALVRKIIAEFAVTRNASSYSMASSPPQLPRFRTAMDGVYGPLPSSKADAEEWTTIGDAGGYKGRYLWTDAFGVVNFITLYHITKDETYLALAKRLV